MRDLLNRTIYRAKKLVVLLLLIPLLTGVVAYWNESNNTPMYTAETTILLGNFENEYYTNPELVKVKFSSDDFIKDVNSEQSQKLEAKDIKESISISVNNKILTIKLTHKDKEYAETTLDALTKEFISESNTLYKDKKKFYNEILQAVNNIDYNENLELQKELLSAASDIDTTEGLQLQENLLSLLSTSNHTEGLLLQQELLAEIGIVDLNIRGNEIWEDVSVSSSYTNPLKRAVFGVILGLLVSLSIVILPEIMRKD